MGCVKTQFWWRTRSSVRQLDKNITSNNPKQNGIKGEIFSAVVVCLVWDLGVFPSFNPQLKEQEKIAAFFLYFKAFYVKYVIFLN